MIVSLTFSLQFYYNKTEFVLIKWFKLFESLSITKYKVIYSTLNHTVCVMANDVNWLSK